MRPTDLCTRENIKPKILLRSILEIFLLERYFILQCTLNYFTILDYFLFGFLMLLSFEMMGSRKYTFNLNF